jgi:diguanylate cyclase (GGDEF)-like protein
MGSRAEPKKAKRIRTIRSSLILLVMACIIPASLMVAGLISRNYYQERAQLAQVSMSTARAMTSAVDRELAGLEAALLALATSPYLTPNDLSAFYEQAKEVLKTQNANNIVLIDPTFQQSLNTLRPFGSELPSEANHPILTQVFKTGRPVTTDIMLGAVAKIPLIAVAVPVQRGGKVIYVLAATMFPARLSALLTQQRLSADWIGTILDSTGTIVARTHQMERFVAKKGASGLIARMAEVPEGFVETTTVEGIPVFSVFSKSAVSNWTVAIGIPSKNLTDELAHTLWWFVAGTAMLLLSSLTVAWAIGSKIAGAIRKLAAPALALGSGEAVTVPTLQLKEADEVGRALTKASGMLMLAQHRANHDPLTGLANRALFDEILRHQLAICNRTDTNLANATLAIVYIDLDGFKHVNDFHGHAAGDEVLCAVATRLKNSIRESDLAARLGGDEFALILLHAGLEAAHVVAAKLIDSLSASYSVGPLTLAMSASIGIAAYPESGTTSGALSRCADQAMYKAKAAGKRRYAVAS